MAVFRVVFRGLVADVVHCAITLIVLKSLGKVKG